MMHWGNDGWGMGLGWVYMIVFWAAIFFTIVFFVKLVERKSGSEVLHETPLDVIKRRLARGEITREEFERMKDDLRKS